MLASFDRNGPRPAIEDQTPIALACLASNRRSYAVLATPASLRGVDPVDMPSAFDATLHPVASVVSSIARSLDIELRKFFLCTPPPSPRVGVTEKISKRLRRETSARLPQKFIEPFAIKFKVSVQTAEQTFGKLAARHPSRFGIDANF